MEQERRSIRIGMIMIAFALLFRLVGNMADVAVELFSNPKVAAFLIYLQTGRAVRLDGAQEPTQATTLTTEQTAPAPQKQPVSFAAKESNLVKTSNYTRYNPDLGKLLTSPLSWDLTKDAPAVLIVHTHATEGYAGTPGYRTEDAARNMLRVGQEVADILEANGIGVIHDTTLHDKPSYNGSYSYARRTIAGYLEKYPSIRMVLDIHRDALELTESVQLNTHALVDGQASAQIMLVMGTDAGGLHHPGWQDNVAVGVKLQVLLERENPGICRPMHLRTERFNQDLSGAGMIVEVGAAGDTLEEALVAARAFAESIVTLANGAVTEDSTS
jgi:stage II sporulation protein P